jgi:hypothetical protein
MAGLSNLAIFLEADHDGLGADNVAHQDRNKLEPFGERGPSWGRGETKNMYMI